MRQGQPEQFKCDFQSFSSYFYCLSIASRTSEKFSYRDFLNIRDKVVPFLAAYPINITRPFGYVNCRKLSVMLCFEGSEKMKDLLEDFCFITLKLNKDFKVSLSSDAVEAKI